MKYVYFLYDDGVITGGDTKIFKVRNVRYFPRQPEEFKSSMKESVH